MDLNTYTGFRTAQKSFESKDGTIAYIDHGKGPVILLLHGVPSSGWLYRHMIPLLANNGFRVIAPDMLGFGSSASPKGYELYSETNHCDRILSLMEHLQIDSWHHVMHDAGGLWTWPIFKKAAERIRSLTALNCVAFTAGFKPPMRFTPGPMAKIVMWMYHNGVTTSLMLKGLFKSGLKNNSLTQKDVQGYKTPLIEGKTKAMYYFFSQTCNDLPLITTYIDKIKVPTQIIWGKHDSFLKLEPQQDEFTAFLGVKDKDVHLLDAKHFIQEEEPAQISTLISSFLKELPQEIF